MFSQAAPLIYLHPGVGGQLLSSCLFPQPSPFSWALQPITALHPPTLLCAGSGSGIPWVMLTQEVQSQRRSLCTTSEEGEIPWKSQETLTCFSRTSVILLFTCYPSLYGICRMLLEKLHRFHQWPHRHYNDAFSFFLCSSQRAKVMFWAEALIGAVQLLGFFLS